MRFLPIVFSSAIPGNTSFEGIYLVSSAFKLMAVTLADLASFYLKRPLFTIVLPYVYSYPIGFADSFGCFIPPNRIALADINNSLSFYDRLLYTNSVALTLFPFLFKPLKLCSVLLRDRGEAKVGINPECSANLFLKLT